MESIILEPGVVCGRIKPLHGFNNCARLLPYGPLLPPFAALRPPFARLHDTMFPYGGGHYVDVPCIFRDMRADADDPASYDFRLTDLYIKGLLDAGIPVFYRLGVSIEHAPVKYCIFPPEDPEKWADVCEHIVRHYVCGWAGGFRDAVKYWEIWNEPDGLDPGVAEFGPPMWLGTAQQYYRLYSLTANRIKKLHPEVLVGGYSSCFITGSHRDGKWSNGDISFLTGFLDYITAPQTAAPLDFLSWHLYLGEGDFGNLILSAQLTDRVLKEYGLSGARRYVTEWNSMIRHTDTPGVTECYMNMRNSSGAANTLAAVSIMQNVTIDGAMYYDAQLWAGYGALFDVPSLEPTPAYRVFEKLRDMYELGGQAKCGCTAGIYALAASGGGKYLLAAANPSVKEVPLSLKIVGVTRPARAFVMKDRGAFEDIGEVDPAGGREIVLPADSVLSLRGEI